ncbi:MAG TPA: hypothetical protein EYH34_16295 [Planctomycetes bacterium]|nr:hypothetical protein [Planctomycetota bacterium]
MILAMAVWVAGARSARSAELAVEGSRFTLDGRPTFLLGISYYGALGAPRRFILEDLDDIEGLGFNWIRVWATWSAFGNDVSAVDDQGGPREPYLGKLKWLMGECDRRGMVVDVTLTRGEGRLGNPHLGRLAAHVRALQTLAKELRAWRNGYFDMANEHNIRSRRVSSKYVPFEEARKLRDALKAVDPNRLVTISYVRDAPRDDVRRYVLDVRVDFVSPHRPRDARSPQQTRQVTRQYLAWMDQLGRVVPVHYQEPFRRDFTKGWQPTAEDFVADLRGAIEGGAAGWCFHNGDARFEPQSRPRRSFDMRKKRLFEQLEPVERAAVREVAEVVRRRNAELGGRRAETGR